MKYVTKSVQAIGQIVGFVMGAGFSTPTDEAHRQIGFPY